MNIPILFTGSLEDTMCRQNLAEEYQQMSRLVPKGEIHLFSTGGHPAMLTNAEAFADIIHHFLISET